MGVNYELRTINYELRGAKLLAMGINYGIAGYL